jgi:hypothetical protein
MSANLTHPYYRTLRGYALDPGFSTQLNTMAVNEVTYKVKWEDVEPGPKGEYIEVIDFDPASNCYYEPVDLNSTEVLAQQGLSPSEGNPQFHQQLVYAVIMKTIRQFEFALGRKIIWRNRILSADKTRDKYKNEYVGQLRVYPHAFRDSNAYYDQEKVALLFGYFTAANQIQGSNFPGGVVFTCLSPDVVAHETTHAILDSIHNRFIENTNRDVGAFHEGFSDIVALLQRFTLTELVQNQLTRTQGRLDRYSVLGELATQFGQALENERGALRSAIGKFNKKNEWEKLPINPADYEEIVEPHDRGAILVATIFDAFQRVYQYKTQDLIRIATGGSEILPEGGISPDLVKRLAGEACEIAIHLLHICIRALDYCPPFDITFGDYLRALITADVDVAPEDENGYRVALIEAFRARGIFPDRVNTMSVESLQWTKPSLTDGEKTAFEAIANFLKNDVDKISNMEERQHIFEESQKLQARFNQFLNQKKRPHFEEAEWESLMSKLGLTSRPIQLEYKKKKHTLSAPPLEVHKIRPAYRVGREGRQIQQVIITLSQTVTIPHTLKVGKKTVDDSVKFRGGCSIILSLGNLNEIDFIVSKNIKSQRRLDKQVKFQEDFSDYALSLATYDGHSEDRRAINFKNLHFHTH